MFFQPHTTFLIVAILCSATHVGNVHAQQQESATVKITNPKLSAINMGLDSTQHWLEGTVKGVRDRFEELGKFLWSTSWSYCRFESKFLYRLFHPFLSTEGNTALDTLDHGLAF